MYSPHTPGEISRMLERCRMASLSDLYADVPDACKMKAPYNLPQGVAEQQVTELFEAMGEKNRVMPVCLAGAGFYDRYAPAALASILARSEFATAYTPYQPEISQGTLQYIFEYQTMMTELTGLDVSNASLYDASTACAEAMIMCVASARKKNVVLVSATVNPIWRQVMATYARYHDVELITVPETLHGVTDLDVLGSLLQKGNVAGVVLPQPNYYGIVEDFTSVADTIHAAKALMVMACPAATLGVLKSPAEWGADIAVGDAQSLAIPLSYGGPYLGYMCASKAQMRKMPGRIVGATTDARGQRCFVLTLQAREQHIRRQKATSNICSNQGMMALYVTAYMSLLGPKGLQEINQLSHDGAVYLHAKLIETGKMRPSYPKVPFLNEFAMDTDLDIDALQAKCASEGILAGVKLAPGKLLLAVTERQSRQQLDKFISIVKQFE